MLRKLKLTAVGLLAFASFTACTPEQQAVWNTLNPVQQQQVIVHLQSKTYSDKVSYKQLGHDLAVQEKGYTEAQFNCLDNVIMRESAWYNIPNAAGGSAYGIPQALPGRKMASHGADWHDNPATQIRWLLDYISGRYKDPCSAWKFKQAKGWY